LIGGQADAGADGAGHERAVSAWRRGASDRRAKKDTPGGGRRPTRDATVVLLNPSNVTPELAWSVEAHRFQQTATQKKLRRELRKMCRPEIVWCDTDLDARAHLEPLVHLLAYAIARDLDESAAVVTFGPDGARSAVLIRRRKSNY